MFSLLALEKDDTWRRFLSEAFDDNFNLSFWPNGDSVYEKIKAQHYSVIIIDLASCEPDAFDLLNWIKTNMSSSQVIMTSGTEKAETVVRAIKNGAFDYIVKPFNMAKITHTVQQALVTRGLKNEIDYLRREQDVIYDFSRIVAFSPCMQQVLDTLKKFAETDSTILMTGETGTGKSFLAGSIHFNSHRRRRPFIKINCANIQETLLESELFGHERGAFTGADKQRIGRFEQAHGGTLFLDEIGEMSMSLQTKLLRILEEKAFERVGGNQTIYVDVRVIAATNRDLREQIENNRFREDLFYRINILAANLPPLRERHDCIEPLAHALLEKIARSLGKKIKGFSNSVMDWMKAYDWPGNIRQLANTVERAAILEESNIIQEESVVMPVPVKISNANRPAVSDTPIKSIEMHEKDVLVDALEKSLWIQKDAAELLGISPRTLNYKIRKFGITHSRWRRNK